MNLTDDDRKVIEIGVKAIHRQRAFTNKLEKEMRRDSIRRSRIATKFREQLLRKAFKASGIDYEEILRRQKAEDQSRLKRIAGLKPQVQKNARVIEKRQAGQIGQLQEM